MAATHNWLDDLDMSEFATRLKQLREERQITQARLAELMEIDPRAYNRWERGGNMPHVDTLIKLADILQVTLDELVGRIEPSTPPKLKNMKLQQLYQEVDGLSDEDQQALIILLDSLVARSNMQKLLGESQTRR